jgi:hypothetical protein
MEPIVNGSNKPIFPKQPTPDKPQESNKIQEPDKPQSDEPKPIPRPESKPELKVENNVEQPPVKQLEFLVEAKKLFKKLTKKPKKLILIIVAAIVVITSAILLITYLTSPVHITRLETVRAISSRTENPPIQSEFVTTDPIMLRFEYADSKVGPAVNFEVKTNDGKVVKSGSTTTLRATGDDKADGKRYASIVSTSATMLAPGQYRIVLTMEGREVGAINFVVKEQ